MQTKDGARPINTLSTVVHAAYLQGKNIQVNSKVYNTHQVTAHK